VGSVTPTYRHEETLMSFTVEAADHSRWRRCCLAEFETFADRIRTCNVGKDAHGSEHGEWFYAPDESLPSGHRVIYSGSWGHGVRIGDSVRTRAEIFRGRVTDDLVEFILKLLDWEWRPEFDEKP
jgi:hypothetical protein